MKKKLIALFVDDEPINRLIFQKSLEEHFEVLLAESGAEGLEIIQEKRFDFIVSDYTMPDMNGLEFIGQVREQFPQLPCFIHSALVWDEAIDHAVKSKLIVKNIPKPLDVAEMLEAVEQIMAHQG